MSGSPAASRLGWARQTPEARAERLAHMNAMRLAAFPAKWAQIEREQFWAKVLPEPNSGCLIWTGSVDGNGYGRTWSRRRTPRVRSAHGQAYEWARGPISKGLEVDHLCRVRSCVNPAHLEIVPPFVNNHRGEGAAAKNRAKTQCLRGHAYDGIYRYRNGQRVQRTCRACARWRHAQRRPA